MFAGIFTLESFLCQELYALLTKSLGVYHEGFSYYTEPVVVDAKFNQCKIGIKIKRSNLQLCKAAHKH
jgi:hypothetical protein